MVISPASMQNKTFGEAVQSSVTWTPELREKLQHMVKYSDHEGVCNVREHHPPPRPEDFDFSKPFIPPPQPPKMIWGYPKLDTVYKPPVHCNSIEENLIQT